MNSLTFSIVEETFRLAQRQAIVAGNDCDAIFSRGHEPDP